MNNGRIFYPPCPDQECRGPSTAGTFTHYRCKECNRGFDDEHVTPPSWEGEISLYLDRMGQVHVFAGVGVVNPNWQLIEKRPVKYEHGWGIHDMGAEQ